MAVLLSRYNQAHRNRFLKDSRLLCGIDGFTFPIQYSIVIYHTCFQYVVFIVVGTGVFFSIVFHVGVKEHPRDCSAEFATKSSKRSAANWTAWFREPLFYQVKVSFLSLGTSNLSNVRCLCRHYHNFESHLHRQATWVRNCSACM